MIENRIIVLQRIILIVRLVKHKIARGRIMSRPVINSNIEVPPFFLVSIILKRRGDTVLLHTLPEKSSKNQGFSVFTKEMLSAMCKMSSQFR